MCTQFTTQNIALYNGVFTSFFQHLKEEKPTGLINEAARYWYIAVFFNLNLIVCLMGSA